ncbi:hypothetical protein HOG48_05700 [Candidatus Peregrinibacteria bacterium]|jgi:hypothetical protein|nr:hypothetical protein [Candidatus Peregrinibacteria bacterium]
MSCKLKDRLDELNRQNLLEKIMRLEERGVITKDTAEILRGAPKEALVTVRGYLATWKKKV